MPGYDSSLSLFTPHGHALVGELAQGDLVLDHTNTPQPIRIIDNHPHPTSIFEIDYLASGTLQRRKSIPCANNQLLSLRASAVEPALYFPPDKPGRGQVRFWIRCCGPRPAGIRNAFVQLYNNQPNLTSKLGPRVCRFELATEHDCHGAPRRIQWTLPTAVANDLHAILTGSDYYHVDPHFFRRGRESRVTPQDALHYGHATPGTNSFNNLFKLARTLPPVPAGALLPAGLEWQFVSMFFGDGYQGKPAICGSEPAVRDYLRGYVARLNATRPAGAAPLHLHENRTHAAGDVKANGTVANVDVFKWSITSIFQHASEPGYHWNPVLDGLRTLAIFDDKSRGLPAPLLEADQEAVLEYCTGGIDTDGSYDSGQNRYVIDQYGDNHYEWIRQLQRMASRVGFTTHLYRLLPQPPSAFLPNGKGPGLRLTLSGPAIESLQPYILIPHELIPRDRDYQDPFLRTVLPTRLDNNAAQQVNLRWIHAGNDNFGTVKLWPEGEFLLTQAL